jgi:hypothetical protein
VNDPWLRAAGGVLWVIGAFIVVLCVLLLLYSVCSPACTCGGAC